VLQEKSAGRTAKSQTKLNQQAIAVLNIIKAEVSTLKIVRVKYQLAKLEDILEVCSNEFTK